MGRNHKKAKNSSQSSGSRRSSSSSSSSSSHSSGSSSLRQKTLQKLKAEARKVQKKYVQPNTHQQQKSYVKRFADFCEDHGVDGPFATPNKHTPSNIVAFLYVISPNLKAKSLENAKSKLSTHYVRKLKLPDRWDEAKGEGNPCKSFEVRDYCIGLRKERAAEGEHSVSALAITFQEVCMLLQLLNSRRGKQKYGSLACTWAKCFVVWCFLFFSRIDEALTRRWADVDMNLSCPRYPGLKYHSFRLQERKGSSGSGDGQAVSKKSSKDSPEWRMYPPAEYEKELDGYKFLNDLHDMASQQPGLTSKKALQRCKIFPQMTKDAKTGIYIINFSLDASHTQVEAFIAELLVDSGVAKDLEEARRYRLRCFRRGGAQYRFQYIRLGPRWSLDLICYWGGWSNEKIENLIRYLLNQISSKSLFAEALNPRAPPNAHMYRDDPGPMLKEMDCLKDEVHQLKKAMEDAFVSLNKRLEMEEGPALIKTLESTEKPTNESAAPGSIAKEKTVKNIKKKDIEESLPTIPKLLNGWKDVIRQWNQGDPAQNLLTPLKLWSRQARRKNRQLYAQRALVAREYEKLGEECFVARYKSVLGNTKSLLEEIRKQKCG